MLTVLIFDSSDRPQRADAARLSPLTDLRAVFDVRTGALTTLERLTRAAALNDLPVPDGLIVPDALAAITRERQHARPSSAPELPVNDRSRHSPAVLLVNGAFPLVDTDTTNLELGHALVDQTTGHIVKAHVRPEAIDAVLSGKTDGLKTILTDAPALLRPWHVKAHRDACLAADLALLTRTRPTQSHRSAPGETGIFIAGSATVHPSAIFDAEHGPIVVDDHATIRPGAILVGPCYIGEHSTVLERTLLKPGVAVGPHCKVAGEISGTIFQGYANKAHDGFLGDSYVGEWVNLGAGTTNSNLLNTYADIVARTLPAVPSAAQRGTPPALGPNERTGQQFLGAIIGDHVKTAICTRIMTGAVIGAGTMFAATGPLAGTVPAFSWITDGDDGRPAPRPYRFEKFIEVARAAMARRRIAPTSAYTDRLRALAGA